MAGHFRYTALIDACAFYSSVTSDALMSLLELGFFAAKWSTEIEVEWIHHLESKRPDLVGKLDYRRDRMRQTALDWEVPQAAWRALVPGLSALPDEGDRHVLAAAIAGHADCIVTANLKDFPKNVLDEFEIEAIHPDQFIINQWDLAPLQAVAAFKRMRARMKKPEATAEDFAQAFDRAQLPLTAQRLREASELI